MPTIRDLSELLPTVRECAERLLAACKADGLTVTVTETYRTPERQAELYAKGRTTHGPRVTNAPPGRSLHEQRRALDVAFVGDDGRPSWAEAHPWARLGELGEAAGLSWGGRWRRPDRSHFELPELPPLSRTARPVPADSTPAPHERSRSSFPSSTA